MGWNCGQLQLMSMIEDSAKMVAELMYCGKERLSGKSKRLYLGAGAGGVPTT